MKDYLSAEERNQIMVIGSILGSFDNCKNVGVDAPKIVDIAQQWDNRGNITTEERRSLRTAHTYLQKFFKSVVERMCDKEQKVLYKKLSNYDFRLLDDFTFNRVCNDMSDKIKFVAIDREDFGKWCEEIMHVNCKGCDKNHSECQLHKIFDENFIPENDWGLDNCRYAYDRVSEIKLGPPKKRGKNKKLSKGAV